MARTQDNDTVAVLRAQILRIERRSGVLAHDAARLACGATKSTPIFVVVWSRARPTK